MKKITAMITLLALFTVLCVPMAGAETLPGADFVAGSVTKEANMINNPHLSYQYGLLDAEHQSESDSFVEDTYGDNHTGQMTVTTEKSVTNPDSDKNPHGFVVWQWSLTNSDSAPDFKGNFVFSAQVKKGEESEADSVKFGARFNTSAQMVTKDISDATNWTDFKANLTGEATASRVKFGITDDAVGTKSQIVVNLTSADVAPYLAKEQLYDISNTVVSGSSVVPQGKGGTMTVKAELLNQIGLAYSEQGTFNWYALNEDKTAAATGVTVTGNNDNTATVTVTDTAAAGKYNIVAESAANKSFVRTLTIEVVNVTEFESVVKSENIFTKTTALTGSGFDASYSENNSIITFTRNTDTFNSNYTDPNGYTFTLNGTTETGANGSKTKYVVLTKLKNANATKKKSVDFGMSIGFYKHTIENLNVDNADWSDYKMVLKDLGNLGWGSNSGLQVGFLDSESTVGASVSMDLANTYVAKEQLFNIKTTTTDSNIFIEGKGGTLKAAAKLYNQIDLEYSEQGTFSWLALNEGKTAAVSGITIIPNNTDNTATVTVGANVPAGKYNIIAVSNTDSRFVRSMEIEVKGEEVSALTLSTNVDGTASLAATVENTSRTKILFVLAAYENTALKTCKVVPVDVANGTAAVSAETCKLERLTAGTKVKVFVWSDTLQPIEIGSTFTTTGTIPGSAS